LSRNQRSPKQILSSVVVLLILAVVLYLNWDNKPTSLILTPPPTETSADLSAEVPATQTQEEDGSDPALPVSPDQDFDYYVLSLSWSPQYCATDGSDDSQQCSIGRKLGFVLHGLWPQYERGYPSNCSDESFPSYLKEDFPALYPSNALYTHEWEKHGTCSGLTPADFLTASKQLRDAVVIPEAYRSPTQSLRVTVDQLQQDFLDANPGLSANGLAVLCSDSGRFLSELRVCFTIEGQPRACSAEVLKDASKSCGWSDFLVRNVK
jgi:ribonuclease T2